MSAKLTAILLTVSGIFNGIFVAVLVFAGMSRSSLALLSFPAPEDGYIAAVAVAAFPGSSELAFSPVEIALRPAEKVFLQYSVIAERKQSNILINALYDPEIISVAQTGSGIVITALGEGETVMQFLANSGIRDMARITVAYD